MTSTNDLNLLGEFTRNQSQDAFTVLVQRHLDLVYCAALRQVRSPQLAEEVAQSVFTDLARNAARLKSDTILTAWLYQVTRRTAIDAVRRETRRQLREQIASEMNAMNASAADWTQIEPLLDEAMHALDDIDRTAVLLRYFENKSLREVGQTLGTTDDTARKRVNRAIERLREFFTKHGVTVGESGLVVAISANAIQAAPVGLAITISTAAALAGTTIITTATATVAKVITMTALPKTLVTLGLIAAVGAAIFSLRDASTFRARVQELEKNQTLLAGEVQQVSGERDDATRQLAAWRAENERLLRDIAELPRLRGEVGVLRQQKRELEQALASADSRKSGPSSDLAVQPTGFLPFQLQLVMDEAAQDTEVMTNSSGGTTYHVQKGPLLDHTSLSSATVSTDAFGAPQIQIEFSQAGGEQFAQITKTNINKQLAIILGGKLYSVPLIRTEIPGGKAQIAGSFTAEEATELASKINDAIGSR